MPQDSEASDIMVAEVVVGGMKFAPFQTEMKELHQAISALESALSETWCSSDLTDMDASIRLQIKALPSFTTLDARCSKPIRESRSLFDHELLGA